MRRRMAANAVYNFKIKQRQGRKSFFFASRVSIVVDNKADGQRATE